MRVWFDLTNSPHVLVLRPLIEALRTDGHHVSVTARDFAQTVALAERYGLQATVIGRHRGAKRFDKAVGLVSRSRAMIGFGRANGPFDVAIGHGSNDLSVTARALRIPCTTMFDYEWATVQHNVNCRLAQTVVVPDVIPPERLYRYGARGKIAGYAGLKEEYYLSDLVPDREVLATLGLNTREPIAVVRTPPSVSLYHRFENDLFGEALRVLREQAQTVVLPRVDAQRAELIQAGGFIVPEQAIDAPSLIAFADIVVSAGGTMNREAVALGTPVLTTFEGKLGAVDEDLIATGRMGQLRDPKTQLQVERRPRDASGGSADRIRRDPRELLALALRSLESTGTP